MSCWGGCVPKKQEAVSADWPGLLCLELSNPESGVLRSSAEDTARLSWQHSPSIGRRSRVSLIAVQREPWLHYSLRSCPSRASTGDGESDLTVYEQMGSLRKSWGECRQGCPRVKVPEDDGSRDSHPSGCSVLWEGASLRRWSPFPLFPCPHKLVHSSSSPHLAAGASLEASGVAFQQEGTDFPCGLERAVWVYKSRFR